MHERDMRAAGVHCSGTMAFRSRCGCATVPRVSTSDHHGKNAEQVASPRERVMGFWEHLHELRGTILKSVVVFCSFAGLIGYYLKEFDKLLMQPFQAVALDYPHLLLELGTGSPMEGFNVLIQLCLFGGLMLSLPFILFFIGQFVTPALTTREMEALLPMCVSAFLLFIAGAAFGFFLLVPSAVRVTIEINESFGWAFRWSVGSYYTMVTRLVLGVGATFQFPLVLVLLVWLGLVSAAALRRYRRHAIVGIFVVAAIITPSSEPLSQTLLALPLFALYELAIFVGARIESRRERSGTAVLFALIALLPWWKRSARGGRGARLQTA
jgi:sec-independent protein translocase protein TatC